MVFNFTEQSDKQYDVRYHPVDSEDVVEMGQASVSEI
jgi:hypothetical protein